MTAAPIFRKSPSVQLSLLRARARSLWPTRHWLLRLSHPLCLGATRSRRMDRGGAPGGPAGNDRRTENREGVLAWCVRLKLPLFHQQAPSRHCLGLFCVFARHPFADLPQFLRRRLHNNPPAKNSKLSSRLFSSPRGCSPRASQRSPARRQPGRMPLLRRHSPGHNSRPWDRDGHPHRSRRPSSRGMDPGSFSRDAAACPRRATPSSGPEWGSRWWSAPRETWAPTT